MNQDDRDTLVCDLVAETLDDPVDDAVLNCIAFGALATNLAKAAEDDPDAMQRILAETWDSLDERVRAWLPDADAPAEFLASRISKG